MFHTSIRQSFLIACLNIILYSVPSALAEIPSTHSISPDQVVWHARGEKDQLVLTVSGSDDLVVYTFEPGEQPVLDVLDTHGHTMPDGSYTWELKTKTMTRGLHRKFERSTLPERVLQSGYLTIVGSQFIVPKVSEGEGTELGLSMGVTLDGQGGDKTLIVDDDLIFDGRACVGQGCQPDEVFGPETLRLKQNDVRLEFEDTSSDPGFPSNDWQITVNDSTSGGANRFSIDDLDAATVPFTLEAGSPDHSLYVDDVGRLGLGTSTPAVGIHRVDGDTPTLRLEQDGSSGQISQIWDVGGNDARFFIGNATEGVFPFQIDTAGQSTFSATDVRINLESTATGTTWFFQNDTASDTLLISRRGTGEAEIRIDRRQDAGPAGVTFWVDGSVQADDFILTTPRAQKTVFEHVETADILERLDSLDIQAWQHTTKTHSIRRMGPLAEDFAAAFGLGRSDEHMTLADISGVALASIQALYDHLRELRSENEDLRGYVERLEERLDADEDH